MKSTYDSIKSGFKTETKFILICIGALIVTSQVHSNCYFSYPEFLSIRFALHARISLTFRYSDVQSISPVFILRPTTFFSSTI
ncbi:hypothetical protein V7182_24605, partial [Neobacillus drentensis]|uniref:hypothetical protein n=1 Tax=Neobacillus drentensis TaxID=220684 RepID=UPI002FFEE043